MVHRLAVRPHSQAFPNHRPEEPLLCLAELETDCEVTAMKGGEERVEITQEEFHQHRNLAGYLQVECRS